MGDPGIQLYDGPPLSAITADQLLEIDTSPEMHTSWIVQKFGGTSLGSFAPKIANEIIIPTAAESRVVVVCSAASRSTKLNGTTNRLLNACRSIRDNSNYVDIINCIEADHILAAQREVGCAMTRASLIESIHYESRAVMKALDAARLLGEMSSACVGRIVSAGEKLSCHHIVALLRQQGHKAEVVDASNLEISLQGRSQEFDNSLRDTVAKKLAHKVNSVVGIPVLTGYFGFSATNTALELVGRGYTDLCASLVATGLNAVELEIWKEVDGVFSADPRYIPAAKLLHSLSIAELRDLTCLGSEVVHSTAVDVAEEQNLTILIRNVACPTSRGTLITSRVSNPNTPLTAITTLTNIAVLTFHRRRGDSTFAIYSYICEALQRWQLSVDVMATNKTSISLVVSLPDELDQSPAGTFELRLRQAIGQLGPHFVGITLAKNAALLSAVCRPASSRDCVMATMLRILNDKGMRVHMTMNGTNETCAGCVIEEKHAKEAAEALHNELFRESGVRTPMSDVD